MSTPQEQMVARNVCHAFALQQVTVAELNTALRDAGWLSESALAPEPATVDITAVVDLSGVITTLEAMKTPIKKLDLEPIITTLKHVLVKVS